MADGSDPDTGPVTDTLRATAPRRAAATPSAEDKSEGGLKELFENIAIALILAFMFRAFVVEAYVIPTGSMAPTLLGAHMRFTDPDSGYDFTTNYSGESQADGNVLTPDYAAVPVRTPDGRVQLVPQSFPIVSPTTLSRLPLIDEDDPANDATAPAVFYGDRILVLKYVYLLHDPERWDVVVFKNPDRTADELAGRVEPYQQNFIKRLVGLPGETLMILDGDLYVSRSDKPQGRLAPGDFTIATKPRQAQRALWRIVYDHNYPSRSAGDVRRLADARGNRIGNDPTFRVPWQISGGVELAAGDDGRAVAIDALAGPARMAFDPDQNGLTHFAAARRNGGVVFEPKGAMFPNLTDWLAYDQTKGDERGPRVSSYLDGGYRPWELNAVTDVMLEFDYHRAAGEGPLTLTATRRDARFAATIAADSATLTLARGDGEPAVIDTADVGLPEGGWRHVELQSVDYRVRLLVDGEIVLESSPEDYGPDVAALLAEHEDRAEVPKPEVAVEAAGQRAELRNLKLWRDIYYLNRGNALQWAVPREFPNNLIRLGEDEYFVLGDNSVVSRDSRYWTNAVELTSEGLEVEAGRVPGRFLLGKAFFVYWPAGYPALGDGGLLPRRYSLIPNFGQMRFIH